MEDFNKAIELDPAWAFAYTSRANVYLALGDFNGAVRDCDKAIELDPACALTCVIRGSAHWLLQGNSGEAVKDYNKAIALDPHGSVGEWARQNLRDLKGMGH